MKYFHQSFQTVWLEVQKWSKRTYIFSKKNVFHLKLFPWTAFLANLPKLFCQKSEKFSLKIGKYWKVLYFFKNNFPTICSPGHPVCIFDKLARNFPTKFECFFAGKVGKSRKENWFCQKPISKRSSADVNCSSGNPAKMFLSEVLKSFAQSLENEINTYKFPKKRFLPNCSSVVVAVWQPYQKLSGKKLISFMLKKQKLWGGCNFFKKTSKNSSRFVKLSFDKPAGFFAESPIFFCSKSEKW